MDFDWADQLPAAVTICNIEGIILYMNEHSASLFSKDGGINLIGKTLFDCHPDPAKSKLADLLHNPRVNIYTIEKKGIKKMIYQAPWYRDGQFAGLVEISFPLPDEIPHFVRQ